MLPKEFQGAFDIVIVDLQNFVSDNIKVTKDQSILSYAYSMLRPGGIINRNEDYSLRTIQGWAEHTLELDFFNVPEICQVHLTVGSNSADFLTRKPKDHNIETHYFKPASHDYTSNWGTYFHNEDMPDYGVNDTAEMGNNGAGRHGLVVIIEIEGAELISDSLDLIRTRISKALERSLFEVVSFESASYGATTCMAFVMKEGIVVVRLWPELKYCGFDLHLWSAFDQQETAVAQVVAAVRGNVGQSSPTSTYRIVSGGMFGTIDGEKKRSTRILKLLFRSVKMMSILKSN
jgi:hypothetical protein